VMSRLDLELDLAISVGECTPYPGNKHVGRCLNSDRYPRRYLGARSAEQARERHAVTLGDERPGGHLDRGLRHVVAAEVDVQSVMNVRRLLEFSTEHERGDVLTDHEPCRVDCFRGIIGTLAGDAFAPYAHSVGIAHLEEHDSSLGAQSGRDAKRLLERKLDF